MIRVTHCKQINWWE